MIRKGYVTVFYAVLISATMTLFITMLHFLRESAIKMKTDVSVDASLTACFGEYNRALWDRFDLIFVDSSYMSEGYSLKQSEDHLEKFINNNFDEMRFGLMNGRDLLKLECTETKAVGVVLATDNNGKAIRDQIAELCKYHYKINYIDEVTEWVQTIEDHNLGSGASYQNAYAAAEELKEKYDIDYSEWLPSASGGNDLSEDHTWPLDLLFLMTENNGISRKKIDKDNLPSKRDLNEGNLETEGGFGPEDEFYLREYCIKKLGYYGHEREDSVLSYQNEYLVTGKNSDLDNLAAVARRIMVIREAANMEALYNDTVRMAEIKAVCDVIALVVQIPEVSDVLQALVVSCWASFESRTDEKILLKGGRVPLIKDHDQWITGIRTALFGEGNINNYDEGLCYEDYLRVLMYMTGNKKLTNRLMDVIEMDIRDTNGNEFFRLDNCFDDWLVEIYVSSDYGYDYKVTQRRKILK